MPGGCGTCRPKIRASPTRTSSRTCFTTAPSSRPSASTTIRRAKSASVQKLMQAQHKAMLRDLKQGAFDDKIGRFFGTPVVKEREDVDRSGRGRSRASSTRRRRPIRRCRRCRGRRRRACRRRTPPAAARGAAPMPTPPPARTACRRRRRADGRSAGRAAAVAVAAEPDAVAAGDPGGRVAHGRAPHALPQPPRPPVSGIGGRRARRLGRGASLRRRQADRRGRGRGAPGGDRRWRSRRHLAARDGDGAAAAQLHAAAAVAQPRTRRRRSRRRRRPSDNIFGGDLISEKSLDEVILAYLSEDLNEK